MTTLAQGGAALTVTDEQVRQARDLVAGMSSIAEHAPLEVAGRQGEAIVVPAELADMVRAVVGAVSQGHAITLATLPAELTTTVAAKELGVSRPTLMKLISDGRLPAHKVGTHTRVRTADLREYAKQRHDQRQKAFAELRELDDALDIDC